MTADAPKAIQQIAQEAKDEWVKNHGAKQIRDYIRKELDTQLQQIMLSVFGLEKDSFHGYRVARVNGNEPPIGKQLKAEAESAAQKIVNDLVASDTLMPQLSKTEINSIVADYKHVLAYNVKRQVISLAEQHASELARAIVDTVQL